MIWKKSILGHKNNKKEKSSNQVGISMIYDNLPNLYEMFINVTQKYSPNAKKLNRVPEAKNKDAKNPTDNSFVNDLDSLFYVT